MKEVTETPRIKRRFRRSVQKEPLRLRRFNSAELLRLIPHHIGGAEK